MEKSAEDQLCEAAAAGDCNRMETLLSSGADPTYFDASLMHTAPHGHAAASRILLSTGVPWNALSPSDLSAGDVSMEHGHREAFDDLLNAGVQAELVLGTVARAERKGDEGGSSYLEDRVTFSEDKVMDSESKAVMMTRERPLMEAHAKAICGGGGGGRVLNVGFGMGIVDEAIQRYGPPMEHNIMEAHPDVYERMLRCGRGEDENVKIVFGRWQDVLPQLESYNGVWLLYRFEDLVLRQKATMISSKSDPKC